MPEIAPPENVPEPISALWAKWDRERDVYHGLLYHLLDVAAVAEALWHEVLGRRDRRLIAGLFGAQDEEAAKRALSFAAALHDIGKASPVFQKKAPKRWDELRELGYHPAPGASAYHGTVSGAIIQDAMAEYCGISATSARSLAIAIAGHHGILPGPGQIKSAASTAERGSGLWDEARKRLVDLLVMILKPESTGGPQNSDTPRTETIAMVGGLVSVADWIGSSELYFPYHETPVHTECYMALAREQAQTALSDIQWSKPMTSGQISFTELFPSITTLRPMQEGIVSLVEGFDDPALIIVEAPTGEGKTEAALYAADYFNRAQGQRGCYVGMPTQATANAMFDRFRNYLDHAHPDETVNFHLVHGNASLSNQYQQMQQIAQVYDKENAPSSIVAHSWFSFRKRGLLSPYAVGTADQALLGVLQCKHVLVRLFGLSNKTVIFDEVHAYDTYTSTILDRLLEWLAALGCNVLILSATLPSERREQLLRAYAGADTEVPDATYPAITWATGSEAGVTEFDVQPREPLQIRWADSTTNETIEQLRSTLDERGCVAWICNTVGSAQETYRRLVEAFGDADVELDLFHARYPFGERQKREERAVRRFGKEGDRPNRAILVATQVIEQSLDLDFDLMISEVAPVDLIIQRAGRLHRHERPRRPETLQEQQIWLIEPETNADGLPDFGASSYIYSDYVLLRTWLELHHRQQLQVPEDVSPLIEAVYTEECLAKTGDNALDERITKAWQTLQAARRDLEAKASQGLLPAPDMDVHIWELAHSKLRDDDDPKTHPKLRAATRHSDRPSVQVICLYGDKTEAFLDSGRQRPIDLSKPPGDEQLRALMDRSVSLSGHWLHEHFIEVDVPAGWRRNALLRYCRPVLLDPNGDYATERFTVHVDDALGVIVDYQTEGESS